MITDADVKKLEKTFATKIELEKLDARTAEGFADVQGQLNDIKEDISEIKIQMSTMESNINKEISGIRNDMLTMEDNIVGAINKLHIENRVTATYRPKIEDHEQRITKVETVVFAK